ncbi:hypothetical protein Z043_107108, partial [Scleropages formosus]
SVKRGGANVSFAILRLNSVTAFLGQCSYVPPCERDNQKNKEKVLLWQDYWTEEISSQSFTCFFNQQRRKKSCLFPWASSTWSDAVAKWRATGKNPDSMTCTDKVLIEQRTLLSVAPCRPDDVLWKRSHDENVLLHCVLWPLVSLLLGTLIVLLTICARSLAVRAEAIQKRKLMPEFGKEVNAIEGYPEEPCKLPHYLCHPAQMLRAEDEDYCLNFYANLMQPRCPHHMIDLSQKRRPKPTKFLAFSPVGM